MPPDRAVSDFVKALIVCLIHPAIHETIMVLFRRNELQNVFARCEFGFTWGEGRRKREGEKREWERRNWGRGGRGWEETGTEEKEVEGTRND